MPENEAIEFLKGKYPSWGCDEDEYENSQIAIKALEEIQQYRAIGTVEGYKRALEISKENFRVSMEYKAKVQAFEAIGTVEEFKALKEKSVAKKVIGIKANLQNKYCPSCNEWAVFELKKNMKYCPNCGQKLDWSNTTKTEGYADQSGLIPAT